MTSMLRWVRTVWQKVPTEKMWYADNLPFEKILTLRFSDSKDQCLNLYVLSSICIKQRSMLIRFSSCSLHPTPAQNILSGSHICPQRHSCKERIRDLYHGFRPGGSLPGRNNCDAAPPRIWGNRHHAVRTLGLSLASGKDRYCQGKLKVLHSGLSASTLWYRIEGFDNLPIDFPQVTFLTVLLRIRASICGR